MHHNIMLMHPIAGLNSPLGKTDDLPEFDYGLALGQGLNRHFMAARDPINRRNRMNGDAFVNRIHRHNDIVGG